MAILADEAFMKAIHARYILVFIIPAITLVLAGWFTQARGFHFLSCNSDPAYNYLINSLNVASCRWVQHMTHPGTTTQVVGGITVKITDLLKGTADLETDVLLHPEYYLEIINKVLIGLNILALIALGALALYLTGNVAYSLLLQLAPFVSWQDGIMVFVQVTPESMNFFTCLLLVMLLLWITVKDNIRAKVKVYTLLFALIAGFGLASKLTFVPLALIPFIILPGPRWKMLYAALAFVAFHIFIFPAWGHYDFITSWVKNIFVHSGAYGTGDSDLVDSGSFSYAFETIINRYHTFILLILTALTLLGLVALHPRLRAQLIHTIELKMLIAVTIAVVVQVMIVSKHFLTSSTHYLIPSFCIAPFLLYLVIRVFLKARSAVPGLFGIFQNIPAKTFWIIGLGLILFFRHRVFDVLGNLWIHVHKPPDFLLPWVTAMSVALILWAVAPAMIKRAVGALVIGGLLFYQAMLIDIPGNYHVMQECAETYAVVEFIEQNYPDVTRVFRCCASSKQWALKYGSMFDFLEIELSRKLGELYAEEQVFFLQFWQDGVYAVTWDEIPTPFRTLLQTHHRIILHGYTFTEEEMQRMIHYAGATPTLVYGGGQYEEAVYLFETE